MKIGIPKKKREGKRGKRGEGEEGEVARRPNVGQPLACNTRKQTRSWIKSLVFSREPRRDEAQQPRRCGLTLPLLLLNIKHEQSPLSVCLLYNMTGEI